MERRAGTEGNANQQSTLRTQGRERVTQALGRVRKAAIGLPLLHPRWELDALIGLVQICAGGIQ